MSGICKSCNAPIEWARFAESGKRVPLDLDSCDDGNLIVVAVDADGVPLVRTLTKAETADTPGPRFKTHFATCATPEVHRRGRNRGGRR